jgi:hypothetical protein
MLNYTDEDVKQWYASLLKNEQERKAIYRKQRQQEYQKKHRHLAKIRSVAREAVKAGQIKKQSCEICGNEKSEMHHPNYDKPFYVKWLCRKHHKPLHHRKRQEEVVQNDPRRNPAGNCNGPAVRPGRASPATPGRAAGPGTAYCRLKILVMRRN